MKTSAEPPTHVGHRTNRKTINGDPMRYVVLDEIIRVPTTNRDKAIYLQLIKHETDGRLEMRLCYFMIGQKGKTKGRWVFGQYAPMIGKKDFRFLLKEAQARGWVNN